MYAAGEIFKLRAENLRLDEVNGNTLLPSQKIIAENINSYLSDPELSGYIYYLNGLKGSGKTLSVLWSVSQNIQKFGSKKISFLTFDPEKGPMYHPDFVDDISDSEVAVLNDEHYHMEALANGSLDREKEIGRIKNFFDTVKNRKMKAVIITDTPIDAYLKRIRDKDITNYVKDAFFMESNELLVNTFQDLHKLSEVSGMNMDRNLIWSIYHTKPNPRYMKALSTLYGDATKDLRKFANQMKSDLSGMNLPDNANEFFRILLDNPLIYFEESEDALIAQLRKSKCLCYKTRMKPKGKKESIEIVINPLRGGSSISTLDELNKHLLKRYKIIAYAPNHESRYSTINGAWLSSFGRTDNDDRFALYDNSFLHKIPGYDIGYVISDPLMLISSNVLEKNGLKNAF